MCLACIDVASYNRVNNRANGGVVCGHCVLVECEGRRRSKKRHLIDIDDCNGQIELGN